MIARLASAFARHGVEARHLRAYKGAADREAGLVEQVIMPLMRQRNPQAREAAAEAVEELSELGGELRAALLAIWLWLTCARPGPALLGFAAGRCGCLHGRRAPAG